MSHAAANSPGDNTKVRALVEEFLEHQRADVEAERRTRDARASRKVVAAGIATVVCMIAWAAPYPPATTYVRVSPRVERAGARMALYLAAQRVNHYRTKYQRTPRTLGEAGVSDETMSLVPGPQGSYVILKQIRHHTVSYDSNTPLQSALGDALAVIERTGR